MKIVMSCFLLLVGTGLQLIVFCVTGGELTDFLNWSWIVSWAFQAIYWVMLALGGYNLHEE